MTTTSDNQGTTLVVGATGKTGRRVLQRLRGRDVAVRAGSRTGDVRFDWEDRSTWAPALAGATSAYVSYYPDLGAPGASGVIGAFAAEAVDQGARRLVLLSGRGEEEALRSEQALAASGVEWTVVRCSWFCQNFSESFFLDPLLAGELALPVDGVLEPFVDADDVADVAVAALTENGHGGQVYELSGPRALTFADAVAEIGRACGRELRYTPIPMDDFAAALADEGTPAELIELMRYLFSEVLDGRNTGLCDGVQRALGRQPRDFADFAREAAAAGVWDARS